MQTHEHAIAHGAGADDSDAMTGETHVDLGGFKRF